MKIENIFSYGFIVLSISYSTFIVADYLTNLLEFEITSYLGSLFLCSSAHYFGMKAIEEIEVKKTFGVSLLISLILSSMVFYCEWNTIHEMRIEKVDFSKFAKIEKQIEETKVTILANQNKRDWRSIENKRSAEKLMNQLQDELKKEGARIELLKSKELVKVQQFRAFSIIFLILAILSTKVRSVNTYSDAIIDTVISTNAAPNKKSKILDKNRDLAPNEDVKQDLINKAIKSIQNGETDRRLLMNRYKLNVRKCNELITQYSPIKKKSKKIGF